MFRVTVMGLMTIQHRLDMVVIPPFVEGDFAWYSGKDRPTSQSKLNWIASLNGIYKTDVHFQYSHYYIRFNKKKPTAGTREIP